MNNSSLAGWRSVAGSNTGERRNFLSPELLTVAFIWDIIHKCLRITDDQPTGERYILRGRHMSPKSWEKAVEEVAKFYMWLLCERIR